MKKLALFFICILGFTTAFAHTHARSNVTQQNATAAGKQGGFFSCEIKVVNNSLENVKIYGVYEDGSLLEPFDIYYNDTIPHIIYLDNFFGFCDKGMKLSILSYSGNLLYSGYVKANSTVWILPYLGKQSQSIMGKQSKVEVKAS